MNNLYHALRMKTSHATTNMLYAYHEIMYCNTYVVLMKPQGCYNIEITSSCFTYANYATTAMHDAQAHNFYNTLYVCSSYVHLLKVVFGVKSACKIMYTPSSPVSIKKTNMYDYMSDVQFVCKNTMYIQVLSIQ